ncbi:AAA family ATPase (plasmid) [Streptomyces scopuliridis]|uniref:AAA family ATPase n=1 Tax=Streptomyces scopuliridis TaxID=452529 RepID=A0ACD4ZYT1_9ACTN|nr:BTAD domain-containing putative transcriptional regulator [Streptomyces scopuliridis]WSC03481.1 AAA family ATPase [Streptomyces scopuliridis]WSC11374.1 AAA family ATPase [Streptomyces scopuliridis]
MNPTNDALMKFLALGPIQVLRGGSPLGLGPPQRKVLLARLLIQEGGSVPVPELIQCLWRDEPPPGAVSSLRAHVSRLRSVLDPARKGPSAILVAEASGYALKVPRGARDTAVFEDAVHRARTEAGRGLLAQARRGLDEALGLWRGQAFQDVADQDFAVRARSRLDTLLQEARELQATVLLKQGDVPQAIRAAENLIMSTPLREASWALLMRALYADGRQTEALHHYERFRGLLVEQGLEPSPGLKRLQTGILRHDTGVVADVSLAPARALSLTSQKVGRAFPLAGRAEEMSQLSAVLSRAAAGRMGCAVVSGEPGIGKSRLLQELAARAESAGFTVLHAKAGPGPGPDGGPAPSSPAAQLLHALRLRGRGRGMYQDRPKGARGISQAMTGRPVLCLVDDVDAATPGFRAQLAQLVADLSEGPIAVVCAMRDVHDPISSDLLTALARREATWLVLEPLTPSEIVDMVAGSGEPVTPAHAVALHHRSAGNPFVVSELLKLPADRRTGAGARVPTAVRSAVLSRLSELPDLIGELLAHAAVDGEWLDMELLADILDTPLRELLPLVDTAVAARLLIWEADPDGRATSGYRFPQLPREVVLSTLAPSTRQILHATFAERLTSQDDPDQERLAGHLRGAGAVAGAARAGLSRR